MFVKKIFLFFFGLSSGFMTAAGVCALITSIGVMTRIVGKTHTSKYMIHFENAILFGAGLGNIAYLFKYKFHLSLIGGVILGLYGLGAGTFVGCLSTALAELIDTSAIFTRRLKIKSCFGFLFLSIALGKLIGSLIQFWLNWGL